MIINLVPYRAPIDFKYNLDAKDLTDGGADKARIQGTVTLNPNGTVTAKGTIQYIYDFDCDLCAAHSSKEIVVPFDEVFSMTPDEDQYYFEGDSINLEPMLRDYLVLSVPTRRLCKEDCKGLCPVCGGDRNVRECSCVQAADEISDESSPFDVLKNFGGKK